MAAGPAEVLERFYSQMGLLPLERARVRFSKVLTRDASGIWRVLLYHRDIQPFNEDGTHSRALTVVK